MPAVQHRYVSVDGLDVFYREAGPKNAPTVLLLHGFPSSSIQFRCMLHELSDDWHLIAPDLPGFGFTRLDRDRRYCFSFDGLAATIKGFAQKLRLDVAAMYLHDYGAQVGFRLLTSDALHPCALIVQNSEAFREIGWRDPMLGIEKRVTDPPQEARARLRTDLLNEEGIRKEFLQDLPADLAQRIDPAVIELGWRQICRPWAVEAMLDLHMDYGSNIAHYAKIQAYLRDRATPVLVLWGERDQFLSTEAARAYKRDLPNVEVALFDSGHWLLETHADEVNSAVRDWLQRRAVGWRLEQHVT